MILCLRDHFTLWEQFIRPSLKAMRTLLRPLQGYMGTLLPLVTQTLGWGSQTASTSSTKPIIVSLSHLSLSVSLSLCVSLSPSLPLPLSLKSINICLGEVFFLKWNHEECYLPPRHGVNSSCSGVPSTSVSFSRSLSSLGLDCAPSELVSPSITHIYKCGYNTMGGIKNVMKEWVCEFLMELSCKCTINVQYSFVQM